MLRSVRSPSTFAALNLRLLWLTEPFLYHEIEDGSKKAGVKRIRVHDLRHSHVSLLVEMGFSPLLIAERLGHERVQTTIGTYSHLYPNKQTNRSSQQVRRSCVCLMATKNPFDVANL